MGLFARFGFIRFLVRIEIILNLLIIDILVDLFVQIGQGGATRQLKLADPLRRQS